MDKNIKNHKLSVLPSLTLSTESQKLLHLGLSLLELKSIEDLPGIEDPNQVLFFIHSTASLIKRHGEEWIRAHKIRLVEELKYISEF